MRVLVDLHDARTVVDLWCKNAKYASTASAARDRAAQALLDHIGGPGSDLEAPLLGAPQGYIIANTFDLGAALGLTPDLPDTPSSSIGSGGTTL